MVNSVKFLAFLGIFFLLWTLPPAESVQAADTRYVSDVLVITMRQGPGNQYKIVKTLRTDTALEVLEEQKNYIRARTKDGEEGWVLTQYVSTKTPKAQIINTMKGEIASLKKKMEKLTKRNDSLASDLKTIQAEYETTHKELTSERKEKAESMSHTTGQLDQMTERYNTLLNQSQHVVELTEDNETLLTANNKLNKEVEYLQQENTHLKRSGGMKWFLAGGGVFLAGFIAAKTSTRKKKYY